MNPAILSHTENKLKNPRAQLLSHMCTYLHSWTAHSLLYGSLHSMSNTKRKEVLEAKGYLSGSTR